MERSSALPTSWLALTRAIASLLVTLTQGEPREHLNGDLVAECRLCPPERLDDVGGVCLSLDVADLGGLDLGGGESSGR